MGTKVIYFLPLSLQNYFIVITLKDFYYSYYNNYFYYYSSNHDLNGDQGFYNKNKQ